MYSRYSAECQCVHNVVVVYRIIRNNLQDEMGSFRLPLCFLQAHCSLQHQYTLYSFISLLYAQEVGPILYSNPLNKSGQDFLDIQY